jgi:ABC-2 type transport system ATP-binding protein
VFSSHILSDAELLCSRVGILSKGRLVASGTIDELTSGGARGWEVVVTGLTAECADRLADQVRRVTMIAEGRYVLEVGPEKRPEAVVADLAAMGASLVSVTTMRTTLEDVFLKVLGRAPAAEPVHGMEPVDR